ncbi:MAG: hypothetical protein JWR54_3423 [Mucilaginibacter sp.]|nr:hypothetical protein [Mucilaginibacter sp.]
MKKITLSLTLLLVPVLLFAQAGGSDSSIFGTLMLFLIGFAIALGIFLLIRSLMLWYWKVYDILQNQANQVYEQKQTNYLLGQQIELLNKHLGINSDHESSTR